MRITTVLSTLLLLSASAWGQMTTEEYIATYKHIAIEEMQNYRIPASITLAQGILESNSGNSALAVEANNHFGIKCHKEWSGDTFYQDDDEKNECFRKYENPEESYRDHSLFLTTRNRYSGLFELEITDYQGWAKGLKAAGYATNPVYAKSLIDKIEFYNLTRYDQMALGLLAEETPQDFDTTESVDPWVAQHEMVVAYSPEDKSAYELAELTKSGRFVYLNNGVKFIYAKEGDTPIALAKELSIFSYQIYKYNYLEKGVEYVFRNGDLIYIEPLANRCRKPARYVIQRGENLRDVALKFGVKLEKLQKRNKITENTYLSPGKVIRLK